MSKLILFRADVSASSKRIIKKGVHYEIPELQYDPYMDFLVSELNRPIRYGLAEYIHDDSPIYNKVFAIGYKMHGKQCIFRCAVSNDFNEETDTPLLRDYIKGQVSDGWAENGIYIWSAQDGSRFKHIWLDDNVRRCYIYTPLGAEFEDEYEYHDSQEEVMKRYGEDMVNFLNQEREAE